MWNVVEGVAHVVAQFKTWESANAYANNRMLRVTLRVRVVFVPQP